MEDHAGLHAERALEERPFVAHPRAVVDVLGGGVETLAGIEALFGVGQPGGGIGDVVAQGLKVRAGVEVVFELEAPFAEDDVQLSAAGRAPAVVDAPAPLGREKEIGADVEVEESVELPSCVGIQQEVVGDVLVADAAGEMEEREGVARVKSALGGVAAGREDAEHLARAVRIHSFPVEGQFDVAAGMGRGDVTSQESRETVLVEPRGVAEEGARIVARQLAAVEDAGDGPHAARVETVVEKGLDVGQELALVAEVLQEVDAEDQAVFRSPLQPRARREPGGKERLRPVERVAGILAVVEARFEADAREELLGACPADGDEAEPR